MSDMSNEKSFLTARVEVQNAWLAFIYPVVAMYFCFSLAVAASVAALFSLIDLVPFHDC
jgi:hypothetical protein